MTILSFNNDPALKALHVAQAEQHAVQDMLVSGTFGEIRGGQFRGCSVGCFAHEIDPDSTSFHATVADARGLPEWLIRLQDSMFEGLPADKRGSFHVELAKRIPVGVDLSPLPHIIAIARIDRMLVTQGAALSAGHPDQVNQVITKAISALEVGRRFHEGAAGVDGVVESARSAWSAAWSAAAQSAAAQSAAWSADSAAWSADSAAAAAAAAAESAAESAARSAWSAAWSAAAESAAAQSAAWSADSAAWSAESAAAAAAAAAAESAAESAEAAAAAAESAESAAESAESARSARSAAWIEERDALFSSLSKLEA